MDTVQHDEYLSRIHRVQDYVEQHLSHEFTLDELAAVARFSKYHFNRLFHAITGESLFRYIYRIRIERAAALLLYHPRRSITEIALACGFSSPALFARAFKSTFGTTAGSWRTAGGRPAAQASDARLAERKPPGPIEPVRVTVERREAIPVVYLRYVGDFAGDAPLFEELYTKLIRWAQAREHYDPEESRLFCIIHDNPGLTEPKKLRVSCCLSVRTEVTPAPPVGAMTIPAGRYVRAEYHLRNEEYGSAWSNLFRCWLPDSGYQPDDGPAFEEYLNDQSVGAGKQRVLLCFPVRPL